MKKLQVKITFKSGRTKTVTSNDYYKGQFRDWCIRNFAKEGFQSYDYCVWNDIFINVKEIETVEEIQ